MYRLYRPITATPFQSNASYRECAPCEALKPYIRCFWGTAEPVAGVCGGQGLVIPDTCMDILFDLNYTKNTCGSCFCGINDRAFCSLTAASGDTVATFAIRFYPWASALFAEDSISGVRNQCWETGRLFAGLEKQLRPYLFEIRGLSAFIAVAQPLLLKALHSERQNSSVMNAVYDMIAAKGAMPASAVADRHQLSLRQLERLFAEHIGIPPKQFSSLVRYQLLLREWLYSPAFDVQDAVCRYGYTDQAHLLKEFKKFHTMTPGEAKRYARSHL